MEILSKYWQGRKTEMKVFIVGSGSWGTALGNVLTDNAVETLIYGRNESQVNDISRNHKNTEFFGDVELNHDLKATADLEAVNDYDCILLAVPSSACIKMAATLNECITKPMLFVNVAKGFNGDNYHRLSEDVIAAVDREKMAGYCALLGPSHAEEVILRMQTTINAVSENEDIAVRIQRLFSNRYFRVYTNSDMIGCEYAAGLKNIIAIASGILYGLGLGDNAKASLMTRGLAEMSRYGIAKGGRIETFMGLCGMGDLIVTCTSAHSRNWQAGYLIGKENNARIFWETNSKTVEGVAACKIIRNEAEKLGISMPITNELYDILFNDLEPKKAIDRLMTRELKSE